MMSSICLAMTAVSFGVAASARRTQPANGAAAVPASNRRLVISVMVSSPVGSWLAAVCRMHAVCREMAAGVRNALLLILHPGMVAVHRGIRNAEEPALCRGGAPGALLGWASDRCRL